MHYDVPRISRATGAAILALAIAILAVVWFANGASHEPVFSDRVVLQSLWGKYKEDFLEQGTGRTLDPSRGNVTTSEGEAYTMLRAAWMDDRATFDQSYKWTKDNLGRDGDSLSSWLFGESAAGKYAVLVDQGGQNSASDADVDIALALVFAYGRWHDQGYLDDARARIGDIWDEEVMRVGGRYVLLADDLEKSRSAKPIVNPSYLSPAAFRVFDAVDPDPSHEWSALADDSYGLLEEVTRARLSLATGTGALPPNWVAIDRESGAAGPTNVGGLDDDYGFDAMRTSWRVALDYRWFGTPAAERYLASLGALGSAWRSGGSLASVYGHGGAPKSAAEAPAAYGGAMGYFAVADPDDAEAVYSQKLKALYDPDAQDWRTPLGYYDANWAWFGIGLYGDLLPNLAAGADFPAAPNRS